MKIDHTNPFLRRAEFDELDDGSAEQAALTALVEQVEAGGLAELDDAALEALGTELRDGYAAARPNATTDEAVEALARVAAAIAAVEADGDRRVAEAEAREARLAELDAQVTASAEDESTEDAGEGAEGDGDAEGASAEGDGDAGDAEGAATGERIAASSAQRPAPLAALNLGRTRGSEPVETPAAAPLSRLTAGAAIASVDASLTIGQAGVFRSLDQMGAAVQRLHRGLKVHRPTDTKHYIGTVPTNVGADSRIVDVDELARQGRAGEALTIATERLLEQRRSAARQVASGGSCVAAQPDYTVNLVGEPGTLFVQTLPTVTSSRPIAYYPWIEVDVSSGATREVGNADGDVDPFDATGHVTDAQDAAGYVSNGGATPDKSCLHITCIDSKTCKLEATYRCVTIGNFIDRAFPEFVQAFDEYTRIGFDDRRDELAQAVVLADTNTKIVTAAGQFGAAVDVLGRIRLLARSIRSRRRSPNLPIDVYVPTFAGDMIAQDIAAAMFGGSSELRVTPAQALALLALGENIFVNEYQSTMGTTSDGSPTVLPAQDAGALNEWPTEIRIGVWPTGAVFHQQGWELSFGLKEVGMATNDYSTFMELAEATCTRSTDLYVLDVGVCVNGARGAAIELSCAPQIG